MRVSFWLAVPTLALGVLFSYMADSLIALAPAPGLQTAASMLATILFVVFSALLLGLGAALFIHWVFSHGNHYLAFVAEIFLSFALFFIGLGGALTIGIIWTAAQLFLTFLFGSIILFSLSFISLFGGVAEGIGTMRSYIKKRFGQKKMQHARPKR